MLDHVKRITAAEDNEDRAEACLDAAKAVSAYDDPGVAATLILAAAGFAQAHATDKLCAATDKLRAVTEKGQERVRDALVSLGPV